MTSSQPAVQDWINSLRASHERFAALVKDLDADSLNAPSYDTGWTIAQVASHLGSGGEISGLMFDAGLSGTDVPNGEVMQPIWATWNARSAVEQRDEAVAADEQFVRRFEALSEAERESYQLDVFGMHLDLAGLARLRLAEHAVHTWDIAVAIEPTETVAADAVELLLDGLGATAARSGKPSAEPFTVLIATTDPERSVVVSVGAAVAIEPADPGTSGNGTLTLPAEAYLRLVYGRLDADHTPPLTESGTRGLADLRATFQGF